MCIYIYIYIYIYMCVCIYINRETGFPGRSAARNLPAMQETQVPSLGRENPMEKETATHSSILGNPVDRGAWQASVHGVTKESDST